MITCRINGDGCAEEIEYFHNGTWTYEYLDRGDDKRRPKMKIPIQRFRCKDRKNDINFYYLEFHDIDRLRKIFSFKTNGDRTLFLLTYFGK